MPPTVSAAGLVSREFFFYANANAPDGVDGAAPFAIGLAARQQRSRLVINFNTTLKP